MSALSEYHIESLPLKDVSKIPFVQELAALDLSNSYYPLVVVEAAELCKMICEGGEQL
jgi:hypothetical protein